MILFLCEKPSQAKDIGRVLGATYRRDGYLEGQGKLVTWCIGHLLEMTAPDGYKAEWKSWRLESLPIIPEQWKLEVTKRGGKQFKIIQGLLQGIDEVVLATDADREGETIGREVLERCLYKGKISRLWLSALDDASINKALGALLPGEKTRPLYKAGMGRARADWLVGMNLSRAYTILGRQGGYDGVLSVGRVQTPTLKLVVDRDRQIENFKPVTHFELTAHLRVKNGSFNAKWIPGKRISDDEGRCLDREVAMALIEKIQGETGQIAKAETKRIKEPPPLPLELSTLQQEASKRWGLSAKKTLEVAQALYEKHKATTYPRTDCRFLPKSQFKDAPNILQSMAGPDSTLAALVQAADTSIRSKAWNDKKITAHHAIIPTAARVNVGAMSRDEALLFDLIRRHYLAQFFPHFEFDRTVIDTSVKREKFRASGRVEKALGWKQVLGAANKKSKERGDEEQTLPLVKKGDPATVEKINIEEKQTRPPKRYTEGTLIQAMKHVGKLVDDLRLRKILRETSGIGTEATRANIIETLLKRKLLANEGKKNLISMPAGRALVEMLPHSVTDPATTAVWEQVLDDISHADGSLDEFMGKAELWINKLIGNVKTRQSMGINIFSGLPPQTFEKKPGQGTASTPDTKHDGPLCPQCKSGRMIERTARVGQNVGNRFMGCSAYPSCRNTQPMPVNTAVESAGIR
jgi:DNA topoisomerase III